MISSDQGINALHWTPRVDSEKVARLYESEARGLLDEELLEDVALSIYCRLQSVTIATTAALGRVECPCCLEITPRESEVIQCPQCGWQVLWSEYFASYHAKHLIWGGAFPAVRDYMDGYLAARTTRDKLMLIDRFIHFCHWEMIRNPGRPAATMVLEGKQWQVLELIERLAYSDASASELVEERRHWQEKHTPTYHDPHFKNYLHAESAKYRREGIELAERHRRFRLQWKQKVG